MKVLGIETSGNMGGIAVCEKGRCILARNFGTTLQHDKKLVSTIKEVLQTIGWMPFDIDLIAVNVGPGSYTGLRIGIACAKTLAYALQKPVVDVPVFDIVAENYDTDSIPICPILDARRKHVYACLYISDGTQWKRQTEFLVIPPEDLLPLLPRPVIIFGDGILPYKEIFRQEKIIIEKEEWAMPKAENVALLGQKRYLSGHRCELRAVLPLYLRKMEVLEKQEQKG
ncbi:MAG: tRNA (adenosine(37)-N6)-threonylcarbamoyltransferase complex dimerization subunit type 1 TsaB [Candidatus Brocadiaceae bacterium]|nr:tRNA (adenosine(37)-N6)-threonylcarbamoyltransferase complex dimerization subunit type 1 TsaB [Candidatus Brocadiaceae bacterium]